jgi:hypothetical protein
VILLQQMPAEHSLLRPRLAARQVAAIVVVFDDAYRAASFRIAFDDRQGAVGAKRLDGFGHAIKVVIANFAHDFPARISLNKVDLPIEVTVALYLHYLVISDSFDDVGFAVAIGIDRDLVFVLVYPRHPLVGTAVARSMSHDTV